MKSEQQLDYRILSRDELGKQAQIDRTETIERVCHLRDGDIALEEEHWDVQDWSPQEKQRRIASLHDAYDAGATIFGAFDGTILVGMSVLDHNPLDSGVARYNLAGLWVSRAFRNQRIGKALVRLAKREARKRGAKALYVSATPSENTVRFYISQGFRLARTIDPQLFKDEPDDIHLELRLQPIREMTQCLL